MSRLQEITDFEEVKKYINQQVLAKKEPYFSTSTWGSNKLQELAQAMTEAKNEETKEEEREETPQEMMEHFLELYQFLKQGKGKR